MNLTKEEILKDCNIESERLQQEKPMLHHNILKAMEKYAEQQVKSFTIPKRKCDVKVVATGEHCPDTDIHQIDGSENYLCDRCYENWLHTHQ